MIPFWQLRTRATHFAAASALAGLGVCAVIAAFGGPPSDAAIDQHRALVIARQTKGDLSEAGLRVLLSHMDPATADLGRRFDPRRLEHIDAVTTSGPPDPAMVSLLPGLNARQAQTVNAGLAFSDEPNPPARPFTLKGASAQDRQRALGCLTQAVYYEAGFEPVEGAQAVAQVVINRVRHSAFPKTICGVVFEGAAQKTGCQFSFTCDGSLSRLPAAAAWKRAQDVAERALNGFVMAKIGGATHYHTEWVVPYWAPTLTKVSQEGSQIFYRWPGDWGLPGAFRGRYAGGENPGVDVGGDPLAALGARVTAQIVLAPPTKVAVLEPAPAPVEAAAAPISGPLTDLSTVAPDITEDPGRPAFSSLH
jgi:hypothetical protein